MSGVPSANGEVRCAEPIAVVGMRGRFPGANDLDELWRNLAAGVESITVLSPEDVRAAGVPPEVSRLPGFVNAAPLLDGVDQFDAAFFGYSARDASLTDPQHRLFLETAWEALEDAGYDPASFPGTIGVFGGCEMSTYLYQLSRNPDALGYLDGMQVMVTNDKDHLCTQVSYRLDLRGPSVVVQTTCSTSLVAVALACESLRSGRSDMALAGGVTVRVPQRGGYWYAPGSILSPDGHCRPFDAKAQGTIVGSGVGIVVLKTLRAALADGDRVRAVIRGEGVNNDGNDKVGYTAPSYRGQAAAIAAAYRSAGVSPASVGYVEAHGTGTILGDPIEVAALTDVFRAHTDRRGFCGIGSVKSNFGHLSCASGVTGLIKAVLALEQGAIPPTVHYRAPNPAIDFAASPFFLTTRLHPWTRNGSPRRAGVSSFGVGGTNVHLVLEEAPADVAPAGAAAGREHDVVVLSARSAAALDVATARLGAHLERHPELDLADVAYTLQVGRRAFRHRRALLARAGDRSGLVAALSEPGRVAGAVATDARPVVFLFPGQGSQYPGMAEGLYRSEPVVRAAIDRCAQVLEPGLGVDLRRVLFPPESDRDTAAQTLRNTAFAQPAIFTVSYAVAELWRSWGVRPAAMIGHSIGEYVAAVLAGVLDLDDALRLISHRGRLIASLPRGSMLSVMAPPDAVEGFLDGDVSLAAVNAPGFCVLSGPDGAIERVERALAERSVAARRLHTSHAFHSAMMDPVLGEFEEAFAGVRLSPPRIPYVATLTGGWADGLTQEPEYWSAQLRSTVRFADGLGTLAAGGPAGKDPVLLEVGPGRTLVTFASQPVEGRRPPLALPSLPSADERRADEACLLGTLARAWAAGVSVDWRAFHGAARRRRVSLPTYPFERQTYWIGPPVKPIEAVPAEPRDTAGWFYLPVWRESLCNESPGATAVPALADRRVLVFDEGRGLGAAVAKGLRAAGARPIVVRQGSVYRRESDDAFVLDPRDASGFPRLAEAVCGEGSRLAGVVDCWSAAPPAATDLDDAAVVSLLAPMRLAHALGSQPTVRPLPVLLAARGTARVREDEALDPARAFGVGVAKVLPQELPGIRVVHADVDADPSVADLLVAELGNGAPEPEIALRDGRRHVRAYEPRALPPAASALDLPASPVVLITGGVGHMGLILAEALADRLDARLVLVTRSPLPDPDRWVEATDRRDMPEGVRATLRRLVALRERHPGHVFAPAADLDDAAQVAAAVDAAIERYGRVDLVIHGAANVSPAAFASVAETGPSVVAAQLTPKIRGLFHLLAAMKGREPARWVLHSSISSVLGGLALGAYAGANAVLDVLALQGGDRWLSIGWDAWENAGEAHMAGMPSPILALEGQESFLRALGAPLGSHVLVVVGDFAARFDAWVRRGGATAKQVGQAERHARPDLTTPFVEPRTETERALAEIWGAQLGVAAVGIHDRFFDLGGHSLLGVQVASEIRDRFEIEMPVLELFKAPTIAELAVLVDRTKAAGGRTATVATAAREVAPAPATNGSATPVAADPLEAAKASYRAFYDDVTRKLERSGVGEASFFLNYGYVPSGDGDEARFEVPERTFNPSSVRLAYELIGPTDLAGKRVLDIGCGRGGNVALLAERFGATATGVDLSPEAVAFCRRAHRHPSVRFEVGDAERLPFLDGAFDAVTNVESSHTYPDVRAFLTEVRRVLASGGWFLHTDLLPVGRWAEVRALLGPLGLTVVADRLITPNVLASCDLVAATRAKAFGEANAAIDEFLAVPGTAVYEQMRSGAWEYRIVRARRS